MPFFAFTGEGNKGETFTHKSLFPSFLQSCGEGKKRKTADARATRARWGLRPVIGALSKRPVHSILSIVLMSTSNLKYTYCLLCMLLSCAFRYEVLD